MSGVILATAIGSGVAAAGGGLAVASAGIAAGTTLYGGAKSFSDANKARKRGEAARREAIKAVEEAKKRIDINRMEQLSIAKEPYELMREAQLVQGATGLQAGVEGEARGAAATAGRIQMAQGQQQAQIRAAQAQRMDEINRLVAEEDARIDQQLAGIALAEAEGAQQAIRDAEVDRAAYITQGVGTLGSIAEGLATNYAEGNFGQARQGNRDLRQSEGVAAPDTRVGRRQMREGDRLMRQDMRQAGDLSGFGFDQQFDITAPTQPDPYTPPGMTNRELRQVRRDERRAANDIQRANAQAAIDPAFGGPVIAQDRTFNPNFSPLGTSARPDQYTPPGQPMSERDVQRMLMEQRRLGRKEAREIDRAIRRNPELLNYRSDGMGTSGPLDPFDPFGGSGFIPPSSTEAAPREAVASVAPAGLGGEPAPAPVPERRPVQPRTSVTSGDRETARRRMEANIEATSGLTGAELTKAKESIKVTQNADGEFTATYGRGSRAQVQSVGEPTVAKELLDKLAEQASEEVVAPDPTPKQVETVNEESVKAAASVGPATEEVVQRVVQNTEPENPLPIAMQWLDVNELDPEGVELRSDLWSTIHGKADTTAMVDENWAWCAAFVNYSLTEAGADTLVTDDPYNKGRAKAYETFGESVKGSNTKEMLGNAREGDIVVKKKMVPILDDDGNPTGKMRPQYHVGFFSGYNAETGMVNLLGGNQNDQVNITAYPVDQVTAVRRIRVADLSPEDKEAMSKIMVQQEGQTR